MSNSAVDTCTWRRVYVADDPKREVVLRYSGFISPLQNWFVNNCLQPCWVLMYNFASGACCVAGNSQHELTPDKILLIPPNTVYSCHTDSPVPHFFLWFTAAAPFNTPRREIIEIPAAPYRKQLEEAVIDDNRMRMRHCNLASSLLLTLPESFFLQQHAGRNSNVVEQALNIIVQKHGRIKNSELAGMLHISVSRLAHLFKEEVGISLQRYCLQAKMSRAELFLQQGWNIENAAEFCGYSDRFHFSKEFKNYHGISPGRWQKQFISPKVSE